MCRCRRRTVLRSRDRCRRHVTCFRRFDLIFFYWDATEGEIAGGMYIVRRVYEQDKRLLIATAAKYVRELNCCGIQKRVWIQKRVRVGWALRCVMCVSGNPWTGGMMLASARPASLMWGECVCKNGDSTWTRMRIGEREWRSMHEMDGRLLRSNMSYDETDD